MNFTQRLGSVQRKQNSLLCIGLDTDAGKIPPSLRSRDDAVLEFNRQIIGATHDLVCGYKLNLAFYEALGECGWSVVHETLEQIPEGIITIGDAKRGDIGNSSALYARALIDKFKFTASTVSPYMGFDSLEPFLLHKEHGVFVLAVTSNPGARDFQYLKVGTRPLYEHVIRKVHVWNTRNNCGLVVGATRPEELRRIRRLAPDLPFLIPGIGAQGGDLRLAVHYGCGAKGNLAVITASRSILYASHGEDFAAAARTAAIALRDQINAYRREFF